MSFAAPESTLRCIYHHLTKLHRDRLGLLWLMFVEELLPRLNSDLPSGIASEGFFHFPIKSRVFFFSLYSTRAAHFRIICCFSSLAASPSRGVSPNFETNRSCLNKLLPLLSRRRARCQPRLFPWIPFSKKPDLG